jgi:MoxR-like ATPase
MGNLSFLSRAEIESLGPPIPEELDETGVSHAFLRDLALKHVATLADPTTTSVAEKLHLPLALTDELLYQLYREKLIEIRLQSALGQTRYAMLDHGWERVARLQKQCGYAGPAPVTLNDYSYMMRVQAKPSKPASMNAVRTAFRDLVLPESLLNTLGCAVNSRSSLFLTGLPGTGKTAVAERMNAVLSGTLWIPYAIEIDGQIIRVYDHHNHRPVTEQTAPNEFDRRWIRIERPMIVVGGELTLENTDLVWSEYSRFYEAPFQMKSNGGTLVIDELGRQRVSCRDLLNRWIMPLEKRVDFLTLHSGKKIEVPFEQLVIFSTNLEEKEFLDEAFLRRMGYRARLELPTPGAYGEIFRRAAISKGLAVDHESISYLLRKYGQEHRQMKCCEPRDLLNRISDICSFEGRPLQLSEAVIDAAWRNYFGAAHGFEQFRELPRPQSQAVAM